MTTFSVTYGRWAESYDRSMARRASVERRERLEMEREGDLRRERAEEEFQVRSMPCHTSQPANQPNYIQTQNPNAQLAGSNHINIYARPFVFITLVLYRHGVGMFLLA